MRFVLIFLVALTNFCYAQISITKTVKPEPGEEVRVMYDSLRNEIYGDMIGQELFLLPMREPSREYGYRGLYLDFKGSLYDKENIYKPGIHTYTSYDSVLNKAFIVKDII